MTEPLIDSFGRRVKDLRLSITDRCNFRCTYCMPAEGLVWLEREEILTYEELARIARVCVEQFGFDSIRLTGGEPTVRAHVDRLIAGLAPLGTDLALTTNGARLTAMAATMAAAGLQRINVSLDTLRADRFATLTRRDELDNVIAGIDAAVAAGLDPVKVNAVVMRGVNDDEIVDLAAFARDRGLGLRYIEFMPLDADGAWTADQVVPAAEILAAIDAVFPIEPAGADDRPDHEVHEQPATLYRYRDGRGDVGVIPSVTEPFCAHCDRVRVTADGKLRACLFALEEADLRSILRGGGPDDDVDRALAAAIAAAVAGKWAGHHIGAVDFVRPDRSMSQIGG